MFNNLKIRELFSAVMLAIYARAVMPVNGFVTKIRQFVLAAIVVTVAGMVMTASGWAAIIEGDRTGGDGSLEGATIYLKAMSAPSYLKPAFQKTDENGWFSFGCVRTGEIYKAWQYANPVFIDALKQAGVNVEELHLSEADAILLEIPSNASLDSIYRVRLTIPQLPQANQQTLDRVKERVLEICGASFEEKPTLNSNLKMVEFNNTDWDNSQIDKYSVVRLAGTVTMPAAVPPEVWAVCNYGKLQGHGYESWVRDVDIKYSELFANFAGASILSHDGGLSYGERSYSAASIEVSTPEDIDLTGTCEDVYGIGASNCNDNEFGVFYNLGVVEAGAGFNGSGTEGGKGGNVTIVNVTTFVQENAIKAGNGGKTVFNTWRDANSWYHSCLSEDLLTEEYCWARSCVNQENGVNYCAGKGGNLTIAAIANIYAIGDSYLSAGMGGDMETLQNDCASGDSWCEMLEVKGGNGGTFDIYAKNIEKLSGNTYSGDSIYIDPTITFNENDLHINAEKDVFIYGGDNWELRLNNLSSEAVTAGRNIILAVGEGGVVDLRHNSGIVFKTGGKLEVYADNVLLDPGVTLENLTQAEVVRGSNKIIYHATLTGSQQSVGKAGETVSVRFRLHNAGPKQDTYTLTAVSKLGWNISGLPSSVTIAGLSNQEFVMNVTLPETYSTTDIITVTAASSQSDSTGVATMQVTVSTEPTPDSNDPSCSDPATCPGFTAGVFKVGKTGIVKVDFLFDGGMYEGELGIFSLAAMESLEPNSPEFIAEAVRRVLSNSEQGCIVISDRTQGARFSGQLGSSTEPNRNKGVYKGLKTCNMKPGDTFATVLVPNASFTALAQNPATTDSAKRPIFSLASSNPEHEMYTGQIAKIKDGDEEFTNAVVYEDMLLSSGSDRDYNDLIVYFSGVTLSAPTLDNPELGFKNDWRKLSNPVIRHIEVSPPSPDTLWVTVTLKSPADLFVYDPQGNVIGKEGGSIPGATFETDENGHQIVSLPKLDSGEYRIVLRAIGEGGLCHLEIKGYQGENELTAKETPFTIGAHETYATVISADDFLGGAMIEFDTPDFPVSESGKVLHYDYDGDGKSSEADIARVSGIWNKCKGSAEFDEFFDVDGDGCITVKDIMKVAGEK